MTDSQDVTAEPRSMTVDDVLGWDTARDTDEQPEPDDGSGRHTFEIEANDANLVLSPDEAEDLSNELLIDDGFEHVIEAARACEADIERLVEERRAINRQIKRRRRQGALLERMARIAAEEANRDESDDDDDEGVLEFD